MTARKRAAVRTPQALAAVDVDPETNDLKARLLAPRIVTDTVDVDGVGTITVRSLSRAQMFTAQKLFDVGQDYEAELLRLAMVDPPVTHAEALVWQRNSPGGELEEVTRVVNRLSRLSKDDEKESYKSV